MESAMRQITQFLELINLMGVKKKMVGEGTGTYRLRDLRNRDFPGSPVVKNLPSTTEDMGLIPGQGTKIPTCHLVKPKINKLEKTTITKKPHQKTII